MAQVSGLGDGSLATGELLTEGVREQRRELVVDGFTGNSFMVKTDVKLNSGSDAEIFVRYQDPHNAYRVSLDSDGNLDLDKVVNGYYVVPEKAMILLPAWRSCVIRCAAVANATF